MSIPRAINFDDSDNTPAEYYRAFTIVADGRDISSDCIAFDLDGDWAVALPENWDNKIDASGEIPRVTLHNVSVTRKEPAE